MNFSITDRLAGLIGGAVLAFSATAAQAADLPSLKAPETPPAVDDFQPFFVKVGFTYVLNTTSSNLSGQSPTALARGITTAFPSGVGATIGDVPTLGFESGIYVTRHISVNIGGGIPMYVNDKTVGFNPANPVLANGTVLTRLMPAFVPMTVNWHFDNFGPIRPYIGAGIAPGFSFSNQNAFLTGVHVGNSIGAVIAAGADYMIDRHWGVSLDVKKTFAYVESYADGMNIPGVGVVPAKVYQNTHFEPWAFSLGILYRFGPSDIPFLKY